MTCEERKKFWETLCSLPGQNKLAEQEQLLKTIKFPKYLYRYRPVNTNNLEALKTNRLYFSSANYYDDPFDTFLYIDIEAIKKEYLSIIQSDDNATVIMSEVKRIFSGILKEDQLAQLNVENLRKAQTQGLVENFLRSALSLRDAYLLVYRVVSVDKIVSYAIHKR